MTSEREKYIRKEVYENVYFCLPSSYEAAFAKNAIYDLLEVIDKLREENARFNKCHLGAEEDLKGAHEDIEELQDKLAVAVEALEYISDRLYSKDLDAAMKSRKALAEIRDDN